jgi:protease I
MLQGKRIAILATDGFEQSELTVPRDALKKAGAEVVIVSLETGTIRGVKGHEWADEVDVDVSIDTVSPNAYDALMLPGGVYNPDKLRTDERAVQFVRDMFKLQKPIGAICHGPWLLIEAGALQGKQATSYPSIRTDMKNAGAEWLDEEVVVDNGLVTSRSPDDLDAFCDKLIEEIGEGRHEQRKVAAG